MRVAKLILTLALTWPIALFAQENGISNSTLTTCEGFLVDTGLSAGDYSNNEDITMTICALAPETIINLYWNLFDLGAGDYMEIFDGDTDGAPLIGTYMGGELQAVDVTSSETNPSGCLTVHFVSDGSEIGNFVSEISCGEPCIRPVADVDIAESIPWKLCVGQEISLDATPTVFADGTEMSSFEWNFDDGNTNASDWPVVTHSFDSPGDYTIQLDVTDNVDCSNNNLIDVLVLVATETDFTGTTEELHLCLGQEAGLNGVVEAPLWTGIPNIDFGGALYIPDDQTQCFSSEITLGSFAPGETIDEVGDLDFFMINFEHSFMGDLTISFICPNGQSIAVHQQGGGGTSLGEPIPDNTETAGIGWDYWWSPDATNGTWADEAGAAASLPSGTYDSAQPWDNLIGCPLNGTWEVEICDSWAIDNGFIFDWSVQFDESLYPEIITFTPIFGEQCDSTYWEGPFITDNGTNCNQVLINPTETGTFEYEYLATNNHGCTSVATASVIVSEVVVDAGVDVTICGEDPTLDGTASISDPFFTNWTFEWTPDADLNDGSLEDPTVIDLGTTTEFTLTAWPNNIEDCAVSDAVMVILQEADPLVVNGPDVNSPCPGTEVDVDVSVTGGNGGNEYSWTGGLGNDTSASTSPDETTVYTFTVVDACGLTESIDVEVYVPIVDTELNIAPMLICSGADAISSTPTNGIAPYTYNLPEGLTWNGQSLILASEPGFYIIDVVDDCIASGTIEVDVVPCEILIPNIFHSLRVRMY